MYAFTRLHVPYSGHDYTNGHTFIVLTICFNHILLFERVEHCVFRLYLINVYFYNLISVAQSSAETYEQLNVVTEHDVCAPYTTLGNSQQIYFTCKHDHIILIK